MNQRRETLRLKRRTADQTAVDVALGNQFLRILRLHAAAVLDPDPLPDLAAEHVVERATDEVVGQLRHLRLDIPLAVHGQGFCRQLPGVIAQDLQKVFPDAVKKGVDGFLTIRMEDMFYAVINAIKELDIKYQAQEKRINELEKRIDKLEAKIK